jgi:redox-sensitive bicupin YhaK (pirin superfamily)
LDVIVPAGKRKTLKVETTRNAFAYVFDGSGNYSDASEPKSVLTESTSPDGSEQLSWAKNRSLVSFDRGDEVTVRAGENGVRFLLVSGEPLNEPIAWGGPIVMNTQEELRTAFAELRMGNFIKGR